MKKTFAGVSLMLLSLAGATHAAEGLYVAGSVGYSDVEIPSTAIPFIFGPSSTLHKMDGSAAGGLSLGYQFNQYLAAELGFMDLGTQGAQRDVYSPFFGGGFARGSFQTYALTLDAVGRYPVLPNLWILGRLGVMGSETEDTRSTGGGIVLFGYPKEHASAADLHYGLGLEYGLTSNWSVRGDWERSTVKWYNNGNPNIDYYLASVIYRF